jgi:hypothetical protein
MNLTTATPIRFTISNSTMDSDYVTSRPPTKKRVNQKSSLVKKAKNVKETSFFKPGIWNTLGFGIFYKWCLFYA